MKTLELRPEGPEYEAPVKQGDEIVLVKKKESPWRKLVEMLIDSPPLNAQGQSLGFTPMLLRKRDRLADAFEALSDKATKIDLEDQDAAELAESLKSVRFQRRSRWLRDFCDAVEALVKEAK